MQLWHSSYFVTHIFAILLLSSLLSCSPITGVHLLFASKTLIYTFRLLYCILCKFTKWVLESPDFLINLGVSNDCRSLKPRGVFMVDRLRENLNLWWMNWTGLQSTSSACYHNPHAWWWLKNCSVLLQAIPIQTKTMCLQRV